MCTNKDSDKIKVKLQSVKGRALERFSANKLCCNEDNTQYLTLGLLNAIDYNSVHLLRFHIDSKLNWSAYL